MGSMFDLQSWIYLGKTGVDVELVNVFVDWVVVLCCVSMSLAQRSEFPKSRWEDTCWKRRCRNFIIRRLWARQQHDGAILDEVGLMQWIRVWKDVRPNAESVLYSMIVRLVDCVGLEKCCGTRNELMRRECRQLKNAVRMKSTLFLILILNCTAIW